MGVGAVLEPLTVIVLLFGGTWINRRKENSYHSSRSASQYRLSSGSSSDSDVDEETGLQSTTDKDAYAESRPLSPSLLHHEAKWRTRTIALGPYKFKAHSPNTAIFRNRTLSRLLCRLPFLVECWYWALVYWTYQLGRAFTAMTLKDDTVDIARTHALQLVQIEKALGIFVETDIQKFFLARPMLMNVTNWVYSFIHIPGTIAFLVWLYYYTTTRNSLDDPRYSPLDHRINGSPGGPPLYAARRRTLAVCNLAAFVVFTLWPCMPPRLLSDEHVAGSVGDLARSYGFVDTVHGEKGAGSVWTENRFCNQYAAMPSLHFGYSLMIGLSIMTIPLSPQHRQSTSIRLPLVSNRINLRFGLPSWRRALCVALGVAYPLTILAAIIATANHFILDAVAGTLVCFFGWWANSILLNLLPLEDYFLWALRMHKPERQVMDVYEDTDEQDEPKVLAHASLLS
ncbi:integral membrane protein [Talaromyces stipitatus ATCC 10500]|uniref:Integral membrane protein n=1 Tax=Talaromyces stipitatus (strain ATCC 10500 / CBS 375.48 / QM 6759 / NRRL 1006) TaxID=441959 RepID=B8ME21_TALSN|nr:uncharacterized protein TSTA_012070 [Talaromyces stipitatus ATCC 10500]EED16098.1 integral membrane protein [Talaromyces stipitatus ATCC 10500]